MVRNQIDAMQLEHDHKRMKLDHALAPSILKFLYLGELEKEVNVRFRNSAQHKVDYFSPHASKNGLQ